MPMTQLVAADGHTLDAYRASPTATPKGGLVVIQEIFGVNNHIRQVANGYAADGYDVVAPALFDRQERGVELLYQDEDFQRGRALVDKLSPAQTLADVTAAVQAVSSAGKVGIVGYCYGGAVVWVAAAQVQGLACAISYYGSRIAKLTDVHPRIPTMMHVGKQDPSFPMEAVAQVGSANPDVIVHAYDAGHGFNCTERSLFNEAAAALARQRSLGFLAQHVG